MELVAHHLAPVVAALLYCAVGDRSDVGVVLRLALAACFVLAEGALEICGPERASSRFVVPAIGSVCEAIRLRLEVGCLAPVFLVAGGLVRSVKGLSYSSLWP